MPQHPFELQELTAHRFGKAGDRDDFYHNLELDIRADELDRHEWLRRQETYYQRRYCRLFRGTNFPWPAASDIVMPLIDMVITRLKAAVVQLLLTRHPVTFEAINPTLADEARTDEIYFNWHLLHRLPDYRKNVIWGIDCAFSRGHAIFKNFWDFRTRPVERSILTSTIPQRYGSMARDLQVALAQREVAQGNLEGATERIRDTVFAAVATQIADDYGVYLEDEKEGLEAVRRISEAIQSGKEQIVYETQEVEANYAHPVFVDPRDFGVPSGSLELQSADRCWHDIWVTPAAFKQLSRQHKWDRESTQRVLDSVSSRAKPSAGHRDRPSGGVFFGNRQDDSGVFGAGRDTLDWVRDTREGVQAQGNRGLIHLREVYLHFEFPGDRVAKKAWTIYWADEPEKVLKPIRPLPYAHGKWPFVQVEAEINEPRFYSSRSVGEQLDDLDIETTKMHRAKINNLDLMAPTFQHKSVLPFNINDLTFIPGRSFPVFQVGDIAPLDVPDRTINYQQEEQQLRLWAEQYVGGMDALNNQGSIHEARTAEEIRAQRTNQQLITSYRGVTAQISFKEIYDQLWALDNQFGSDADYQRVTGRPRRRKTFAELQRDFNLIPVGTIDTSDPQVEAQKAFVRFQTIFQLWMQATQGTGILQGTHQIDMVEAFVRWMERENVQDARAIIRELSPEEQQQLAEQAAARAERREAIEDNVPVPPETLLQEVKEARGQLPHGGRQRVAVG